MQTSKEVLIAVMGPTGSGKSTFINTVSGSKLSVGDGLKSCTSSVSPSQSFEVFGRRVTLIDTPGFDDTTVSDTDILKAIALYLSTTYEQGYKLSGVIYMQRISDVRMGSTSLKNFNMFRKLCGDSALRNVAIVTNMWGQVTPERGAAREFELASDDQLFKPVLTLGGKILRHDNTASSARVILLNLINNPPQVLRIQAELVDEKKDIADTEAGQELGRDLALFSQQHHSQLAEVWKELQEALKTKDMRTKKELEQVLKDLQDGIAKADSDRQRLSAEYAAEKKKADEKLRDLRAALEQERQDGLEREEQLRRLMQAGAGLAAERDQWTRELSMLQQHLNDGLFLKLGQVLDSIMEAAAEAAANRTVILACALLVLDRAPVPVSTIASPPQRMVPWIPSVHETGSARDSNPILDRRGLYQEQPRQRGYSEAGQPSRNGVVAVQPNISDRLARDSAIQRASAERVPSLHTALIMTSRNYGSYNQPQPSYPYYQQQAQPSSYRKKTSSNRTRPTSNAVRSSPRPPPLEEVVIAIMGATGSGKSTFINLVSGSSLPVGTGLKSCTSKVETCASFQLGNRLITLVDTPGFDDTNVSDTDILKMIAVYLSTTYKSGHKLSGVIYMHRISDFRVGGIAKRNFSMFRKLCGDETLRNVAIVTNMWGEVTPERGAAREHELRTDDALFKPVVDLGAEMLRHDNTLRSAHAILMHLTNNRPQALRIQRELVDEGKDITQTAAGEELDKELAELARKHAQQLAEIQQEMEEALEAKDMETKKELEQVRLELEKNMQKIENDRDRLSREYQEERKKAEEKMRAVEAALEEEKRLRTERQQEIERLTKMMEENTRASAEERAQWARRIQDLENSLSHGGGLFSRIGRWIDSLF
ncbi:hypothetical protein NM688_g527 [Phlebia brevispora]|uniref:Uncharacterized protein n=1 Tax=Phlebia brevispora TaxID=194682 RepID=A0ACC1TE80_9APHY|nr:hypothetical protein NM688_g527 [Phlebia brevispora]